MKKYDGRNTLEHLDSENSGVQNSQTEKNPEEQTAKKEFPFSNMFPDSKLGKIALIGRIIASIVTVLWATASTTNTIRTWFQNNSGSGYSATIAMPRPVTAGNMSANAVSRVDICKNLINISTDPGAKTAPAKIIAADIDIAEKIINGKTAASGYPLSELNSLISSGSK